MSAATRSFGDKHKTLYASERDCQRYDTELCSRQDHEGAILRAIESVCPLSSVCQAADVGAGTGKLARILSPHVASIVVVDRSAEAIAVAQSRNTVSECAMHFHVADLRTLPIASESVDLAVAGWAVSYLKSENETWYPDGSSGGPWREEVDAALAELDRIVAPGGTIILFETMGTAVESSQRSGSWLYRHFREQAGFSQRHIRTDYRFPSKRSALSSLSFFFGKGVASRAEKLLAATADEGEPCIVPEVTGMWWRRKEAAAITASTSCVPESPQLETVHPQGARSRRSHTAAAALLLVVIVGAARLARWRAARGPAAGAAV